MAEKTSGRASTGVGIKPVPMKLYASWEIDKTTPNCIPRICSLTVSHLTVTKPLDIDLSTVILAVSMQNSKRSVLRSTEIMLPPNGLLDTDLEIVFSLQYAHFVKRDDTKLQVMLQRRKRYKNRTILGYKTLAIGFINMAQVLQKSVNKQLSLYSDTKDGASVVAEVTIQSITSQPIDHGENLRRKTLENLETYRDPDEASDEDEALQEFEDLQEDLSNEDLSDNEPVVDEDTLMKPISRHEIRTQRTQRNFKQKLMDILKRFKVSDEVLDTDDQDDQELASSVQSQREIDELMDELEDLSDSGPETDLDTLSIISTPKPSLRPFFAGRTASTELLDDLSNRERVVRTENLLEEQKRNDSDSHPETLTDQELDATQESGSPPKDDKKVSERPKSPSFKVKVFSRDKEKEKEKIKEKDAKEKKGRKEVMRDNSGSLKSPLLERENSFNYADNSLEEKPRKVLIEQLNTLLPADDHLPDNVIFLNGNEPSAQYFYQKLTEVHQVALCTCTNADVRAGLSAIVTKLQKFCNSNAKAPAPIKIVVAGGDNFVNAMLRLYVEQFSAKPPDWQAYVKFLILPLRSSFLGRYLSSIDNTYQSLFGDSTWKDAFDKADNQTEFSEIMNRISRYLSSGYVIQLPIAEAMISCKGKSNDEESSQMFIPFINEVRTGTTDGGAVTQPVEDDCQTPTPVTASQTPTQSSSSTVDKKENTPPNSPSVTSNLQMLASQSSLPTVSMLSTNEYIDLQLDYWTVPSGKQDTGEKDKDKSKKESNKSSIKSAFKSIKIMRLSQNGDISPQTLNMAVVTKEKKPKVIKFGKRKDLLSEAKNQSDGISRLVCTSKTQNIPLKVSIDGVNWNNVKFFQISAQWQTHIKQFPIAIFHACESHV